MPIENESDDQRNADWHPDNSEVAEGTSERGLKQRSTEWMNKALSIFSEHQEKSPNLARFERGAVIFASAGFIGGIAIENMMHGPEHALQVGGEAAVAMVVFRAIQAYMERNKDND